MIHSPLEQTTEQDRNLLTLDEARHVLRISKWSLQKLIDDRRLVTIRIGRRRFVHPDDLSSFMDDLRDRARDGR